MKKVLALRGTASKGKSQTIRKAYDLLRTKYPEAIVEDLAPSWGIDIKVVLTINGVKIGIESRGDPSNRLPESLIEFAGMSCEVIICATRTSGGTVTAVENLKTTHNYELVPFEQADAGNSKSDQDAANRKMAKQIAAETEKALPRNEAQAAAH